MKRSPLSRKTPLASGPGPARKPMNRGLSSTKPASARNKLRSVSRAKDKRWRSEAYLAFVRSLPCAICGTTQGIAAHHLKGIWHLSGAGMKAPDSYTMPVCDGPGDTCHRRVHNEPALRDAQPGHIKATLRAAFQAGWRVDDLSHALAFIIDKERAQ
ncbi:MAG: DUF968 domain-containing protein [Halomonas sp.]|nr:DUF968 domain-containing protein [Halomonas sp.]